MLSGFAGTLGDVLVAELCMSTVGGAKCVRLGELAQRWGRLHGLLCTC